MKKILLLAAITTISLLAANKTFAQYYVHRDRPIYVEHRIFAPRCLPVPVAPVVVNPYYYRRDYVPFERFHRERFYDRRDERRYRRF